MKESLFIPNRTDRDPSILMGVTASEFNTVLAMAIPAVILGTLVFGVLLDSFLGGIFVGILLAAYTVFWGILWVAKIKRGKPTHWLPHTTLILKQKLGLGTAPFIHQTTRYHSRRVYKRKR